MKQAGLLLRCRRGMVLSYACFLWALSSGGEERGLASIEQGEHAYHEEDREWSDVVELALGAHEGLSQVKMILGGEGGIAFFDTESEGQFPNAEFRMDEARLFLEAQLAENFFLFTEINLIEREYLDEGDLDVGELYLHIESIAPWRGRGNLLNLHVGRFDIPFGQEYIHRDAIDNPLISHSLSDIWGVDEGVELYGQLKSFDYTVAVQNGGDSSSRDFDRDKALSARVGYASTDRWSMSISGMRTGDVDVQDDREAALYFGNEHLRAIGDPESTTAFHVELLEGDVRLRWSKGHLAAALGYVRYDDDDTARDNDRDAYYYYVEALQRLSDKLYGAARYSYIESEDGFPIVGQGDREASSIDYVTEDLWRLSLGLGYAWSRHLVVKAEYSFERGRRIDGTDLNHQDMASLQMAFGF